MRAVVIDDEPNAVDYLVSIIRNEFKELDIVGTAYNIDEGFKIIHDNKPELLFLDIEMPKGNGFDLLDQIKERNFDVIFITAYDNYAIKAFKHSAIDYILKPIDIEELREAVERVAALKLKRTENLDLLLDSIKSKNPGKLAVSTNKGFEYLTISDIIRIEAERSYSHIILKDHRKIMVSKGLNEYENLLNPRLFFRVHNSHLINLNHIRMYVKQDGGYIEMIDGSKVPVARRKKESFVHTMNKFITQS